MKMPDQQDDTGNFEMSVGNNSHRASRHTHPERKGEAGYQTYSSYPICDATPMSIIGKDKNRSINGVI